MLHFKYRYAAVAVISVLTFCCTVLCDVYYYFDLHIEWYYALLTIFTITLLIWEGNRILGHFIPNKNLTARSILTRLLAFFIAGNLITILATTIVVYVVGAIVSVDPFTDNLNALKLNLIYGSLINLLFHLLHIIFLYFNEYSLKAAEAEALRKNNAEAQLQLIKSQINPHFLFNNLNVLSGMLIKDNPEANRFIEAFSNVYRYILDNQDKELVPLRAELDFLQPYLFLFKTRFEGGLQVDIAVPEDKKSCYVVPAALQMLIENAIKHNTICKSNPLKITISVRGEDGLSVYNNVQHRLQSEESSKIGLQNISMRYHAISNKQVVVHKTDTKFEVILPLLKIGNAV